MFPPIFPAPFSNVQLLTASSGNYVVPAGKFVIRGLMIGGGAGGGGVAGGGVGFQAATSGGPGVLQEFQMAVIPGQIIPYTCGSAGAGGAAGANNGTAGGDTTFGSLLSKGGFAGTGSSSGTVNSVTALQIQQLLNLCKIIPTVALFQISVTVIANSAGSSGVGGNITGNNYPFGIPGSSTITNSNGNDGQGYGMPGSGAGSSNNAGNYSGGNGTPGAIIITC